MDFSISRTKRPFEFNMKNSHTHTHYELYILLSGNCRIFVNHTLHDVEPGDVIVLKPGAIHRTTYHSSPASERVTINFEEESLADMEAVCGPDAVLRLFDHVKITIPAGSRTYVEDLIGRMEHEEAFKDPYSRLLTRNYFYELLVFLFRCRKTENSSQRLEVEEAAMEAAAEYIYHHFNEPVTLKEVADMVHMSTAYFSRKFKAVTGFGYKEYLIHVRVREAERLLLTTKRSVTDIALECGFGDGNYFGDAFKKIKGMAPRHYRKSHSMEGIRREEPERKNASSYVKNVK